MPPAPADGSPLPVGEGSTRMSTGPSRIALRHLGPPQPTPPRSPGPMAFADPDYVREFLSAAGFAGIAIERAHPDMVLAGAEEEAGHALVIGPTARLIDEKQPDSATRENIRAEIAQALAAAAASGPIRLPSTVLLVTARRPG